MKNKSWGNQSSATFLKIVNQINSIKEEKGQENPLPVDAESSQ